MTRSKLIEKILSTNKHLKQKEVEQLVKIIFDTISDALAAGKSVSLRGFGTFIVKTRKPRIARNPKTGEFVKVPQKNIPFLKTGKKIHSLLNPQE